MSRRGRIFVTGLRGIPGVQGGIETHAQHLYPRLVARGWTVDLAVRPSYVSVRGEWQGVRLIPIWAPAVRGAEAFVHTFLAVLWAAWRRPDIVHVHAVGPAFLVPLIRLLGLRAVFTHHGPDYVRAKWGWFARCFLRMGETLGASWANATIAVTSDVSDDVFDRLGRRPRVIPNGVTLASPASRAETLERYGLIPGRYVLIVGRLVPEKRHDDLLQAFAAAGLTGWRLVIVGGDDRGSHYGGALGKRAATIPGVACVGVQTGDALHQLYTHAGLFVLPSSHEGMPIAMLEALSYGLPVLASDIPPHAHLGLPDDMLFPVGDIARLAAGLRRLALSGGPADWRARARDLIAPYDWDRIVLQTEAVYETVRGHGSVVDTAPAGCLK